jgi:hypothetical protein
LLYALVFAGYTEFLIVPAVWMLQVFLALLARTSVREDGGRHNPLDKLIGSEFFEGRAALRNRLPLLSGRASFGLLPKAPHAAEMRRRFFKR